MKLIQAFKYFVIIFLLHASASYAQATKKFSIISSASSLSYSEASAVYQMYKNRWDSSPQDDGKYAFTRNRLSLGVKYQKLSVEYIKRIDFNANFSPDSAKVLYHINYEKQIPNNKVFDINLNARFESSEGLKLSFDLVDTASFTITPSVSILKNTDLQMGNLEGKFSQSSSKDYLGVGEIDYYNNKDKIFGLPNDLFFDEPLPGPEGETYTLDLKIAWSYNNFYTQLIFEDLCYTSHWRNLNRRSGVINVNTQLEDLHTEASLKGKASRVDFKPSRLPVYSQFEGYYQLNNWQFGLGAWHYYNNTFYQPFINYQLGQHFFGLSTESLSGKVLGQYEWENSNYRLAFKLGSERLNLRQAHALEFGFSSSIYF